MLFRSYHKDEYTEQHNEDAVKEEAETVSDDGYEIPDFISEDDDVIKIE